ncbi:PepSY-associated TM helix domain-containing protein [Pararcticibacter amylolyticus]|uniref:PepSY domain-containing protein n=1 Tax=Pararcticibacter amylolyticus TaxID=2173175 RepID=A0A2U2PCV3_9SPHI|nr:PepSY-associated TM helix domain-containing protein [Pararcticibacter amylolyticus]PWG79231.1 hypothetical protein DDR33_18265 [Pararcticibacter amylolyticus]
MTLKRAIGKLHLWLGLASGLVVFILGITGCILVFEYDLRDLIYKDRYFIEQENKPRLPVQQMISIGEQAMGHGLKATAVRIYEAGNRTAAIYVYKENPRGWNYFDAIDAEYTVFVNPYNGRVQHVENTKFEFFRLMVMLHYDLLMESIGKQVIGWSTVIFIVLLISGLILWWPKNKAAAKQRFAFRWKDTTKWKRKNYDLHNILGFYALIAALIIGLTGLVWAFKWFDHSLQWLANGGSATPEEKTYHSDSLAVKKPGVLDMVVADMRKRSPNELYAVSIPQTAKEAIYAYSQTESVGYKWTSLYYDRNTGANLYTQYYSERVAGDKLRSMNYYIHTGAILNMPGKILAFIVSFICAGLPVTGFYIWIGRKNKKKAKRPVHLHRRINTS